MSSVEGQVEGGGADLMHPATDLEAPAIFLSGHPAIQANLSICDFVAIDRTG